LADALSDVLRSLRLRGAVFLDARFTAPWAVSSMVTAEACKPMLSWPSQLIAYHMVVEGQMVLSVTGEPEVTVRTGEIVLLPRNDIHVGASEAGIEAVDGVSLIKPLLGGGLARISYGGGGAPTRLLCGFLGCEDGYSPVIAALPRILTVDLREATSKELVEASLKFAAGEVAEGRLADSDVQSRLSELLLIEAVRRYADGLDETRSGWLRALRDPGIGRALALIHQDIAAPWTADQLAREVAMSRSAFMDRFSSLIGVPPIKYLTTWRMETAKIQLRETTRTVAQVAHAIGYESEEAFSRAFKREIAVSPSQWREQQGRR
jgi:AraC-like DNA-binding protein